MAIKIVERQTISNFLDKLLTGNSMIVEHYRQHAKDSSKCSRMIRELGGLKHGTTQFTREEFENEVAYSLGFNVINN